MHTVSRLAIWLLWVGATLAACTLYEPNVATLQRVRPTETKTARAGSATSAPAMSTTMIAAPIITAVPTTMATEVPSPTPQPPKILAVPPQWLDIISDAVALGAAEMRDNWQVLSAEDPAELLGNQRADAALVPGAEGAVVFEEHPVLAVPFTTNWENVSEAEALEIISVGHPLVTIMRWDDIRPPLKALRIGGSLPGDADYLLSESWSIQLAPAMESSSMGLVVGLRDGLGFKPVVRLAAVGDIMLDRALGFVLSQGNLTYPFEKVHAPLSNADLTIGNLESSLGDVGEPVGKSYTFRAPPEAALSLREAGFDIMTLANNHALDFGPEALVAGLSLLESVGIATIGAGVNVAEAHAPHVRELHGLRVAFLGYVNVPVEVGGFDTATWAASGEMAGLAWGEPATIFADVTAAGELADIVIVALHSGYEYVEAPSDAQMAAARAAIDAGADLVIGHHTHVLQGIEFYRNGVIAYGLANFAFEIGGPRETALLQAWLDQDGVRQLEIVPAINQPGGQPRLAEPWEADAIRRQVYRLTDLLNPP